jgi:hypothetical protein
VSRLNAPREIPYDFRVTEKDGWAWLFDDSSRTYACSATPLIYCEALYAVDEDDDWDGTYPDPGYWAASDIDVKSAPKVPVSCAHGVPRQDAWDLASEEAQANCLL